uniref:SCP domain-containing protein n=1 Tax=Lotharella globosa TaxID=91324 RepID=A0A7S4DV39_9EUKA
MDTGGVGRKKKPISKDLREKLRAQKRRAERDSAYLRQSRITKDKMADLVLKRLAGNKEQKNGSGGGTTGTNGTGTIRMGKVSDFNRVRRLQTQIDQVRQNKNKHWRNTRLGRKRVFTVSDLEKMAEERQKAVSNFGNKHELDKIGKEALKYTNEFRAKHGKPPLEWHQALCDIGRVHSKDMGDGKVPFSHVGFKERVAKYPMRHSAAAENLAMNGGIPEAQVARVSVNGWIDSPGCHTPISIFRFLASKHLFLFFFFCFVFVGDGGGGTCLRQQRLD